MIVSAMKQALEALELERPYLGAYPSKTVKAIAALQQAIEEAENQKPAVWGIPNIDGNIYDIIINSEKQTLDRTMTAHYTVPLYRNAV